MAEVVQLPLADHRQPDSRYLHLVRLEGDIIAVKIAAMIDVLREGIDDGVVGRGVQFFFDDATAAGERVGYRSEYLRGTAEGVVRLHFVLEDLGLLRLGGLGLEYVLPFE